MALFMSFTDSIWTLLFITIYNFNKGDMKSALKIVKNLINENIFP